MLIPKRVIDVKIYCTKYTWNPLNANDFPMENVNFFTDYSRYAPWAAPTRDTTVYDLYHTLVEGGLGDITWDLENLEPKEYGYNYFMYNSNLKLKITGLLPLKKADGSPTNIMPRDYFNIDGDNRYIKYLILIRIQYIDSMGNTTAKNIFQGILNPDEISLSETTDDDSDIYSLQVVGFNKEFKNYYTKTPLKPVSTYLDGRQNICDVDLYQALTGTNKFDVDYRLLYGMHFIPLEEGMSIMFSGNIALPTGNEVMFDDVITGQGVLNPTPTVGDIDFDFGYGMAVRPIIYSRPDSDPGYNVVDDWVCKSGLEAFDNLNRYTFLTELCQQMGWIFYFRLDDEMLIEGQGVMHLYICNRDAVDETVDDIDYNLALSWETKASLDVAFVDVVLLKESEIAATNRGYAIEGSNDDESPSLNGVRYVIAQTNFQRGFFTPLPEARPVNDVNWNDLKYVGNGYLFNVKYHDGLVPWSSVTRLQKISWIREHAITFRNYYYTWSGGFSGDAVRNYYDVTYELDAALLIECEMSNWMQLNVLNGANYTSTSVWWGNSYGYQTVQQNHYVYRGNIANSLVRIQRKKTSASTSAYTCTHYGQYVKSQQFQSNFQKFLYNLSTKIYDVEIQDIDLNFERKKRILNYPYADIGKEHYRVIKQSFNIEHNTTSLTLQKINEDA